MREGNKKWTAAQKHTGQIREVGVPPGTGFKNTDLMKKLNYDGVIFKRECLFTLTPPTIVCLSQGKKIKSGTVDLAFFSPHPPNTMNIHFPYLTLLLFPIKYPLFSLKLKKTFEKWK